jgi:hypothetical protein
MSGRPTTLPVTEDNITNITDTQTINIHIARSYLAGYSRRLLAEFQYFPIFEHKGIFFRQAYRLGQLGMQTQMTVLSMNRHKEPGSDEIQ